MRKVLLFFIALLLLAIPVAIFASDNTFSLAENEEYNANIYWAGERMIINGNVNGDIYVAAAEIEINGLVKGDILFTATKSVIINGVVDGNVRGISLERISINGDLKRGLSIASQNIYINNEARIGATALTFAKYIEARGDISGNLDGAAESLFVSGKLTHANVRVDKLVISDTAEIRGNLNYEAVIEAEIGEKAIINGKVNYKKAVIKDFSKYRTPGFFANRFVKLLSLFVLGLILLSLFKSPTILVIKKMKDNPMRTILWGLIGFFAIPFLAIILAITIIGLPIALIMVAAYITLFYITQIYTGLLVGRYITSKLKWRMTWPWALLLGLFILVVLKSLPLVGGFFFFVAVWWGMGGIFQVKRDYLFNK